MKVLLVSQYFWPENFRVNDLVRELVGRGHSVSVLTGKPNYPAGKVFDEFKLSPSAFDSYCGAPIYRVPMLARGTGSLRLMLNYLSFAIGSTAFGSLCLIGQRFDIVFVYEPSPVTVGLPAVFIARLKRAPIVFWVQDLWPETLEALDVVRSRRVLGAVGFLVRFIYNRCALILGQSRGFVSSISNYCSDHRKIRYFPNWAEESILSSEVAAAPEMPVEVDTFTVLFAGNVGDAQDFPAILDAAESLKFNRAVRWVVVGDGQKSDWLRQEVVRRNLESCFSLLGRFPFERMPSFYAKADALLVSLRKAPVFALTVPSKVQSYLMAGIPLLGMLDGEGAAVISEANAGLVCPAGDSAGLAQAVLELMAMPQEERARLGVNGRSYAQREFGREMLIDRLEAWFTELAESNEWRQAAVNK